MKKIPMICIASLPLTVIVDLFKYIYTDWEFAKWIGVAIILDTILGFAKHLIHKDSNSDDFWAGFCKKICAYIALMILSNVLTNFRVNGSIIGETQWMGSYLCTFMMVREAISVLENINAIVKILPVGLLKRFRDFNDSGEYINSKKNKTE